MNVFHLRFSLVVSVKVSRELLMQTCWWPLSDHWSVQAHLTSLVWVCVLWLPWKLYGAICAMHTIYHTDLWIIHWNAMFRLCIRDPLIDTRGKLEEPDKWNDLMKSQWGTHCLVCACRNILIQHQSPMAHLKMPQYHITWFAVSLTSSKSHRIIIRHLLLTMTR